ASRCETKCDMRLRYEVATPQAAMPFPFAQRVIEYTPLPSPPGAFPMRLATILTPHGPRAAIATADAYVDLHATDPGLPKCVKSLLAASPTVKKATAEAATSRAAVKYAANEVKLLPPVPDPAKILCIGLNYRDHAIEGKRPIPPEPVLFGKFPNTLIAHGDPTVIPKVAQKVDYEAELVIV